MIWGIPIFAEFSTCECFGQCPRYHGETRPGSILVVIPGFVHKLPRFVTTPRGELTQHPFTYLVYEYGNVHRVGGKAHAECHAGLDTKKLRQEFLQLSVYGHVAYNAATLREYASSRVISALPCITVALLSASDGNKPSFVNIQEHQVKCKNIRGYSSNKDKVKNIERFCGFRRTLVVR